MVLSMFGGEWNTGFIIQDENENQFVWIPVSNKDIIGTQKLLKKDFKIGPIISKETCLDDNYEAFIESALENGGFYISRYEIGIKDGKVVVVDTKGFRTKEYLLKKKLFQYKYGMDIVEV